MLKKIFSPLWKGYLAFGHFMAPKITFLLVSIIYFIFVPIFSLIRFTDPLKMKLQEGGSYWLEKKPIDTSINGMKRLY
ncbi:MAG: hypothetical protein JW737_02705 [Acidobacteria bacterium]|nr:hypothetical protein [Acidobacteriota bacterium]